MTRRIRWSAVCTVMLALICLGAARAEHTPHEVVAALQVCLTDVMKNAETLGYAGRVERLQPVLPDVFDLGFMAEKSVGRYWKTASPEERERLVSTFTRYIVANYAGRFTGWDGQAFEILGEEPSARGTMLVRTRLVDPNEDDVSLDYRLRRTEDAGWKIVDVYLDGTVSELALRRSEYSSLIKREGFDALLAALDERIEKLASEPASEAS
ncbi:MAG: ABC transporter substrate-binding protein [Myxococcota bacterium]